MPKNPARQWVLVNEFGNNKTFVDKKSLERWADIVKATHQDVKTSCIWRSAKRREQIGGTKRLWQKRI